MKPEEKKSKLGLGVDTKAIKETVLNFVVPIASLLVSVLVIILYVYPSYKSIPVKKG